MHSNFSPLKILLQSSKPGSSSVLTLPQFFLLLLPVAFFSTSPRATSRAEMADVEQTQKMVPLITCEIALCQYVCELVLGVNVFDLDFGVQVDSVKSTNQAKLCGFGTRVSLFDFCLWWSSWSLLHYLQKCKAWRQNEKIARLRKHNLHWITQNLWFEFESRFGCWCVCLMVCFAAGFSAHALGVPVLGWRKNATLQ